MRDYSNITIVAIHGNGGAKSMIPSIERTARALPGAKKLLITDKLVDTNIEQKVLHQGLDYSGYSHFVIYCLHSFIDTEFALIVQDDGWALNPSAWRDKWLEYDYVGGLTHAAKCGDNFYVTGFQWVGRDDVQQIVQNGGFSLRSKRFLEAPSKYGITMHVKQQDIFQNEDVQLCCFMRPSLESVGLKFAPESEAVYFSFEHLDDTVHKDVDLSCVFGHHSRFRRLIDDNTINWLLSSDEMKSIKNEERVYELFNTLGYTICHTQPNKTL
jgi:hypothetical protein